MKIKGFEQGILPQKLSQGKLQLSVPIGIFGEPEVISLRHFIPDQALPKAISGEFLQIPKNFHAKSKILVIKYHCLELANYQIRSEILN